MRFEILGKRSDFALPGTQLEAESSRTHSDSFKVLLYTYLLYFSLVSRWCLTGVLLAPNLHLTSD